MNKKLLVIPVLVLVLTMVLAVTGFACGTCDCGCGDCCPPPPPPPPPPCGGDEGCTPGYWKQPQHFGSWAATGYSKYAYFDEVFGTGPHVTLLAALTPMGPGSDLYRHGVAALLNAASPDVDYGLTVAEVIAAVQAGNVWLLKQANEQFCPLGRALEP